MKVVVFEYTNKKLPIDNKMLSMKTKSAINERIIEVMFRKKITKTALGNIIGVTQQSVQAYLRTKNFTNEKLLNALKILCPEVNLEWVKTGYGEMFTNESGSFAQPVPIPEKPPVERPILESNARIIENPKWRKFPLVPIIATASFTDTYFDLKDCEDYVWVLNAEGKKYDNAYCIEVRGDSMEPTLPEQSTVLLLPVDRGEWQYLTGGVYLFSVDSMVTVKRISKNESLESGTILLASDNPKHSSLKVPLGEIRHIALVERIVNAKVR